MYVLLRKYHVRDLEGDLTHFHVHDSAKRMGRKKLWHENINLTLPAGAKSRMDAVLSGNEDRLDLIREAIDREVRRRERQNARSGKSGTPDANENNEN